MFDSSTVDPRSIEALRKFKEECGPRVVAGLKALYEASCREDGTEARSEHNRGEVAPFSPRGAVTQ